MAYATYLNVSARLPGRDISATSVPSTTTIGGWVTEAEAYLHGALKASQITTPITDSDGMAIMAKWATDYAEGRTRMAHASAGGDGNNDDGKDLIEKFGELLDDIRDRAPVYQAMLNSGSAGGANVRRIRGYVVDNADDLSVADGDFDPRFDMDEEW